MSYDSIDALARVSRRLGLSFPLLSDEGSVVIRRLGLLRRPEEQQHELDERERGLPYPVAFELDASGVVVRQHLHQSHRIRPSAAVLVGDDEPSSRGSSASTTVVECDGVRLVIEHPTGAFRPRQEQLLQARFVLPNGRSLYVGDVPHGLTTLTIGLTGPEPLVVGPVALPSGRRAAGPVGDGARVLAESFSVAVPFRIDEYAPSVELQLHIDLQTCDTDVCYPPCRLDIPVALEGYQTLSADPG